MKELKERLLEEGFRGFVRVKKIKTEFGNCEIPHDEGVYHVLRQTDSIPVFLSKGTGGYFKGKDPNVSVDELYLNWIDDEPILYIGKASDLHRRILQYVKFGSGKNVGHFGGRYIWQLKNSDDLIICWKCIKNSRIIEGNMIADFKNKHNGRRPFANLKD